MSRLQFTPHPFTTPNSKQPGWLWCCGRRLLWLVVAGFACCGWLLFAKVAFADADALPPTPPSLDPVEVAQAVGQLATSRDPYSVFHAILALIGQLVPFGSYWLGRKHGKSPAQ